MKSLIQGILGALALVLGFVYLSKVHAEGFTPLEVPIPPSVWLFGTGAIALVLIARKRKRPKA